MTWVTDRANVDSMRFRRWIGSTIAAGAAMIPIAGTEQGALAEVPETRPRHPFPGQCAVDNGNLRPTYATSNRT